MSVAEPTALLDVTVTVLSHRRDLHVPQKNVHAYQHGRGTITIF
jgi:hypothetical protein